MLRGRSPETNTKNTGYTGRSGVEGEFSGRRANKAQEAIGAGADINVQRASRAGRAEASTED